MPTSKKDNMDNVPDYIKEAVANDEKIAEEDRDVVAGILHKKLEDLNLSKDESKSKEILPFLVAAAGAALLVTPRESHAMADDFVSAILEQALAPIMSLLETLISGAMSIYDAFISGGAQSTSGTLTSSTDAQNHVRTKIEENRLKAATAPAPMQCDSDAIGKQSIIADAQRSAQTEAAIFALTSGSMASDMNASADDFAQQIGRHGNSGANLNIYSIEKADGIQTDEEHIAAADFLKNTISVDKRSPSNDDINKALQGGYKRTGYRLMAEKAKMTNRRQIAMKPLVSAKAANDNREGAGLKKVLNQEVRRTFGSESGQWREEIRGYADPTPLLTELNLLTSFSNFVAVKQLESIMEGTMVDSTHLLELLDK